MPSSRPAGRRGGRRAYARRDPDLRQGWRVRHFHGTAFTRTDPVIGRKGCYRQLSFFGGLLNRWAGQVPVRFMDQWHDLLEPRDPGAVPSPVGRLEARDRWRNGWDAAGAVVPRRRKGPAFGTGIGGAARLAPSVMQDWWKLNAMSAQFQAR